MGNKAYLEIEIKFRIENKKEILARLRKIGAKRVSHSFEKNMRFDNTRGDFTNKLIRLRKDKKSWLTYKELLSSGKVKKEKELEIEVSDFDTARKILESLGFRKIWTYEKYRTTYKYGNTEILLDRTPIGFFLEIEGSEKNILKVARLLGFDPGEGITKPYSIIYEDYCREKGIKPKDLTF